MAFDSTSPLTALAALLTGLSGVQAVHTGVPESLGARVSAYVTLAAQRVQDKAASGLLQREADYFVGIGYRVAGAEATAEADLAALLDAFIAAVYADRTLSGTVASAGLDLTLANSPQYQAVAGVEFRVYPVIVHTTQRATV
jgi:hypothetical protein